MTPTSTFMLVVQETVAVCEPDGGLLTQNSKVRIAVVVPESLPAITVPLTPPKLAVMLVALFPPMATMIIAARLVPLPMVNAGVLTVVTPNLKPELTRLSNVTLVCAVATVSETVVVCVRLPLIPVIVSVQVRTGVPVPVVADSVEDAVVGFGAKLTLAPLGSPTTLRLTWPLKPPVGLMVPL